MIFVLIKGRERRPRGELRDRGGHQGKADLGLFCFCDGATAEYCLVQIWSHLFRSVVSLVRQLYTRDTRRQFCPANHWISRGINLPLDRPSDITFRRSRIRQYRPFRGLRVFTRSVGLARSCQ